MRKNSFAFCGGAYGDEGKGKIVDEYVHALPENSEIVVYRDNGGANAGHTIEFASGERLALHQSRQRANLLIAAIEESTLLLSERSQTWPRVVAVDVDADA